MSDTPAAPPAEAEAVEEPDTPGVDSPESAVAPSTEETKRERFRRHAARTRLQANAVAGVVLLAYLIALAALNTGRVKLDWVFASSRIGLVWIVMVAAILGWLLGVLSIAVFHWRTRRRRSSS
jgi:uncharacterized integral membrane protein